MFIFGYGSLIFSPGINGRGMRKTYKEEDLHTAKLYGYSRKWNAVWNNVLFLGCSQAVGGLMNGVVFEIDESDLPIFLHSEGIGRQDCDDVYKLVDVTDAVVCDRGFKIPRGDRVLVCMTANPSTDGDIHSYYIDYVKTGLAARGEKFAKLFHETTEPADIYMSLDRHEFCSECGDPTGRAGNFHDSVFVIIAGEKKGPLCDECADRLESDGGELIYE